MLKKENGSFEEYFGFDTPDDYEKFVSQKIVEGEFKFVNQDIRGSLYKDPSGRYMKCRKDSFDGKVIIWPPENTNRV